MNFRQIKAIETQNKNKLISLFGDIPNTSGIYILTRKENGFKYAYIGQAKHLLMRLTQHLSGYQHIDLSLKKHGLLSEDNPTGWYLIWLECDEEKLNEEEKYYIRLYANQGYQLRNKTAGGQNCGKFEIAETRVKKGYHDGLKQGYINAQKEVKKWFEKNLIYEINGKANKNKEKSLEKFRNFLGN